MILGLKNNQYNERNTYGFELVDYDPYHIKAIYYEKLEIDELIIDPFGKEDKITYIRYVRLPFTIFNIHNNTYILKMEAPPKTIKSFLQNIYSKLSFGSIKAIEINLEDLYHNLNSSSDISRLEVNKLIINSVTITKDSYAKIEIKSYKNAYDDFKNVYSYKNYKIEKIQFKLRYENNNYILHATSSGSLRYSNDLSKLVDRLISTV